MADNPFAQFAQPAPRADNPFAQFAKPEEAQQPPAPAAAPATGGARRAANEAMEGFQRFTDPNTVRRGVVSGLLGTPGDLEQFGAYTLPRALGFQVPDQRSPTGGTTLFPTTEEVSRMLPGERATGPAARYESAGELLGGFVPFGPAALGLGRRAASAASTIPSAVSMVRGAGSRQGMERLAEQVKSGRFESEVLSPARQQTGRSISDLDGQLQALEAEGRITAAQADSARQSLFAQARGSLRRERQQARTAGAEVRGVEAALQGGMDEAQTGQAMLTAIDRNINALRGDRATIAEAMYKAADDAMATRFAAGDMWQASEPGRRFLADLEARATPAATTQATEAERTLLNTLLRDLRGAPMQGGGYAPSEPGVAREVLRKLRDAASGRPEEGYAAIGQQRAGSLAERLAKSLEEWEPSLAQADARYRELSALLQPAQTGRGRITLAGERYNQAERAVDPQKLPGMFFTSPQGVQQLTTLVGGDANLVNSLAANYASRQLAGKTPEAQQAWLRANETWFNPRVTPDAFNGVTQNLERLSQAQARQARAATQRDVIRKGYEADVGAVTQRQEQAAKTAAQRATELRRLDDQAREALRKISAPVQRLSENYRAGGIPARDLPGKVRELLNSETMRGVPEPIRERMFSQLNELERIQGAEKRARAILKWVAVGALGTGIVGRITGLPILPGSGH